MASTLTLKDIDNDINFDGFLTIIQTELPQGRHIREKDAEAWFHAAKKDIYHDLGWHVAMLNGIGGSAVGTLINNNRGEFDFMRNIKELFNEKLMISLPTESTPLMNRGNDLESIIQSVALKQIGQVKRRPDLLKKIKQASVDDIPWMRGTPDDVWEIKGKIYIIDYKAPTDLYSHEVPIAYQCQLNMYDMLFYRETDTFADGLILVPYDYDNHQVELIEIERDLDLQQEIIDAGNRFWFENVIEGVMPRLHIKNQETIEFNPEEEQTIRELSEHIASMTLVSKALDEQITTLKKRLHKTLSRHDNQTIKGLKLPKGRVPYHVTEKVDQKLLKTLVSERGMTSFDYKSTAKGIDAEQAADQLDTISVILDRHPDVQSRLKQASKEQGMDLDQLLLIPANSKVDAKKLKKYCNDHQIKPPINESIVIKPGSSKKLNISDDEFKAIKDIAKIESSQLVESLGNLYETIQADDVLDQLPVDDVSAITQNP